MYTNKMRAKVVMLGDDEFFNNAANTYTNLTSGQGTSTDSKGKNVVTIASELIRAAGDIGTAWITAKNQREAATTPSDQAKWSQVMDRLEQMESGNGGGKNNTLLIGGGIAAAALVAFLALRN